MRTILVTGSDTGVGKTHAVAALVRVLATAPGAPRIQVVKVVETGRIAGSAEGDAETAVRLSGTSASAHTLAAFPDPLAPSSAARAVGQAISVPQLIAAVQALPECDFRIVEGAGGIASPLDDAAQDWADFGRQLGVGAVVVVVPDRLGAINQARLAHARAAAIGAPVGIWLNEAAGPADPAVAASTRDGLRAARIPLWAEQRFGAAEPIDSDAVRSQLAAPADAAAPVSPEVPDDAAAPGGISERCRAALATRDRQHLRRVLRVTDDSSAVLNLADNDYLELAHDPAVVDAAAAAVRTHGTSASASPLITGWKEPHAAVIQRLAAWHAIPHGMLWSSGYAANSAILGGLPDRGDLVLADRLIHNSMIAGLRRSGARLQRYEHLQLDRLEQLLAGVPAGRQVFVVTESVFSMDGDYPDLRRMAALKRRFGFFWVVDEAHALGWYGPQGAGLVRASGVAEDVDVLVGTFGKTLASGGAYALFRDEAVRDHLVNTAGEFVYSTAIPPGAAAAAAAALERAAELAGEQPRWHQASRDFRQQLQAAGWSAPDGDSPIVPVLLNDAAAAISLAAALRDRGIIAGAVRPPTVPAGTSRLRFSLKRSFGAAEAARVLAAMNAWRQAQ